MKTCRIWKIEFVKRVKEHEAYQHVPIIVVGANGSDADSDDAIACSQGYLTRPFTSTELHALVEKLCP
jgi:DNA-binding response OmpR family regulator